MSLPHNYEMVIGLEVHAQVTTKSKLFSGSSTAFGSEPNTQANEIDLGMPGMLPVLNAGAVDAGIKLGLAIDADINMHSVFARKNYYYPDLPKGYQISQYDQPIVLGGKLTIDMEDGTSRTINITRMHLEEDAGKSIHDMGSGGTSFVDLNRAGVPLMEIVSEPEIRTPEEAGAYMKKLRTLLRFLEICDGDMEKGNLRCDANVSVRKIGSTELKTRCEIKNLNSIRHVMNAIQHEAERQVEIWEKGGTVDQETRLWDPDLSETRTLRSKEDAHDYRYFPDPDLLPVNLDPARIEAIKGTMPELPDALRDRFMSEYGLTPYDASLLTSEKLYASFYADMLKTGADPKLASNWMTVELFAALNKSGKDLDESPISAAHMGELVSLITSGKISGKIAKQVFAIMLENAEKGSIMAPSAIVEAQGLTQISDEGALKAICEQAVASNPDAVAKFKSGNDRIFGSFVGAVMKETKGQANPELVNKLLREAIEAHA
ncbi:MAG: Asp-tRNA(Asn)/Glu-tRNA(Gln) amidotransferase subunit GatB [Blastochloris viridis]|uniref:Aspartyl/glutamyl-tRNA(Asn/Gln) amidotransferase subunit B n=1 Tax=Blastochloris viridis TaxID=1079 RepID=A0A6N4R8T7_BLAVI|nr:MAG: Asp-tRNA(Asn)/Glu-tRNA(Gln) amidotransferase subunit GatB [Blastochloris viridis]